MEWFVWSVGIEEKSGEFMRSAPGYVLYTNKRQKLRNKFTVRGAVRGASLALCAVNVAGCGLAYTFGKREKEEKST